MTASELVGIATDKRCRRVLFLAWPRRQGASHLHVSCWSLVAAARDFRDKWTWPENRKPAGAKRGLRGFCYCEGFIMREFMREPPAELGRDEVLVCMVLAFCIAGASIDVIYNLFG